MTTFLRAGFASEPEIELRQLAGSFTASNRIRVNTSNFRAIPGAPFAYWAPPALMRLYRDLPSLDCDRFMVRSTNPLNEDFRYARLAWEVPCEARAAGCWIPWAKGGSQSKLYSDLPNLISWDAGRSTYRGFIGTVNRPLERPASVHNFFRPGLTWPRRTNGLSMRILPKGAIFGDKGPGIFFADEDDTTQLALLAVVTSSTFDYLLGLQIARRHLAQSFEVGLVQKCPAPRFTADEAQRVAGVAREGWSTRRLLDTASEVSHAFVVPAVLQVDGDRLDARVVAWGERVAETEAELVRVQSEIDEMCFELYGISEEDRRAITDGFGVSDSDDGSNGDSDDEDEAESGVELDPAGLAAGLMAWAVGVAAGRFDVRLATGERAWPAEPDPFDPLPVCSPGMLTGDDGLPLSSLPVGYPVVPSPVLVDDPGHELDLTARVRAVFDVVFGDRADVWWSDVGAALDSRNGVEGWLRRGFFDYHLKTHSKSRRKAPILWPIGTRSGSYRVWLYAHRVTGDTAFRILTDVVEPKLAAERRRLSDLTQEFGPSPAASQRRTVDAQQALVNELIELRDELRAVAPLWHPDLNDGVVIVLAPLWRLFAHHRAWSNELKSRWGKLAKGEYDWAQLAMRIWPERVVTKCAEDRSLAIAHDLEDTFWVRDDDNPDKWQPRQTPTRPAGRLIADRTTPTIHAARTHPNP